jgi:hypothetical protein
LHVGQALTRQSRWMPWTRQCIARHPRRDAARRAVDRKARN